MSAVIKGWVVRFLASSSSPRMYPEVVAQQEEMIRERFVDEYGKPPTTVDWRFEEAYEFTDEDGEVLTMPAQWFLTAEAAFEEEEDKDVRCHWTHDHGPHKWYPLVADPENERVLHLLGEAVVCPGSEEQT